MKKLLLIALAVLFSYGIANATGIPQSVDPKSYPVVWTETVYNGTTSTIPSCYVVEWDFDTSDSNAGTVYDDTLPWVKKCDGNDDVWTAGVVQMGQDIASGSTGQIVIKGPAVVFRGSQGTALTVNTICASSTNGYVEDESISGGDTAMLGVVIKASAAGNDIGGDADADMSLIYVNPTTCAN